jgi:hypothetical protein
MGVWTELVGVRKDLRLRGKWWHHVAVGTGVFSALVVYLIVAGMVVRRPPKLTTSNTFSETLLHEAIARQTTTTLADLDALGSVGSAADNGDFVALPRPAGAEIRCENQAQFKDGQTVKVGETSYQAIPDRRDQPSAERRHCVASAAFAGLSADAISVYKPDGTGGRKLAIQAFLAGLAGVGVWLVFYWNVYYRGLMPIYAKRRQLRKRRHFEQQSVR